VVALGGVGLLVDDFRGLRAAVRSLGVSLGAGLALAVLLLLRAAGFVLERVLVSSLGGGLLPNVSSVSTIGLDGWDHDHRGDVAASPPTGENRSCSQDSESVSAAGQAVGEVSPSPEGIGGEKSPKAGHSDIPAIEAERYAPLAKRGFPRVEV